ncbi:MAG: hypothetical protein ACQEQE_08955 [Bacillota bacterium]
MNTKKLMDIALDLAGLDEVTADSTISVKGEDIKKVLIGIDMETPELLLGKELDVDCVVSHHPKADEAKVNFSEVMKVQIDKMCEFGVPINKAQKALKKRINSVELSTHVSNYKRVSSAASLLNMPFMNIHMPADMIGQEIVQNHLDKHLKPKSTLGDILDILNKKDVYNNALAGPVIRVGSKDDYAGKVAVLFAGGTNGGKDVFKAYFEAGVGTIVCMHVPEEVKKEVEKQNIGNIVVAGHMASDSIGLNKIIKTWEDKGIEVMKMSGIL